MSLKYQNPIIYSFDIKKYYKELLNKRYDNCCCFINKYGNKCTNKCLDKSTFIIREYFCYYHIKSYIDDIIKINKFIYYFTLNTCYINNILLYTYTKTQLQTEYVNCRKYIQKIYNLLFHNYNYIIMTQPVINILNNLIFKYFEIGIYDINIYKLNLNNLKSYNYTCIINGNIKKRKDTINTLMSLTDDKNTSICKIFNISKINDKNIFKIIESLI
jgi:hypothetical protein